MDEKAMFLNGDKDETIYMAQAKIMWFKLNVNGFLY